MENRWVQRQPADCEVVVESPQIGKIHMQARDISLGGMFLVTDANAPPLEGLVDLDFTLQRAGLRVHHHLTGQVVHANVEGIGVMFCDYDSGTLRSMRKILAS